MGTERPSKSIAGMDRIGACVALHREPAAAAGEVEPALGLEARDVAAVPDASELRARVDGCAGCGRRRGQFAAEPELGIGAAATIRTGDQESHDTLFHS